MKYELVVRASDKAPDLYCFHSVIAPHYGAWKSSVLVVWNGYRRPTKSRVFNNRASAKAFSRYQETMYWIHMLMLRGPK